MNILIINAYCLNVNSSANLCHLAYIQGLVEAGHNVTVLSSMHEKYVKDANMEIPVDVKTVYINGLSLYEKLSLMKKQNTNTSFQSSYSIVDNEKIAVKTKVVQIAKQIVHLCYGVYDTYITFVHKTKNIRLIYPFDIVISLSFPTASHLAAYNLIRNHRISCKRWIQIWEDPWFGDIYGFHNKNRIKKEEQRLLKMAELVCYVSPLTLKNRQELFPESAHKMYWQPLPYYYKNESVVATANDTNTYGYFGDYAPVSRDLKPFYEAAKQTDIQVNICGSPNNLFESTNSITIYPRLPLDKLKTIEDKTNVLIFLCNRKGGQIPGKIYQYSATYKTILFILDGTDEEKKVLREYFEKFNRYVFCENTVEDIKRAINDIDNGNIGNVKNEPVEAFNPKETIRKILAGEMG